MKKAFLKLIIWVLNSVAYVFYAISIFGGGLFSIGSFACGIWGAFHLDQPDYEGLCSLSFISCLVCILLSVVLFFLANKAIYKVIDLEKKIENIEREAERDEVYRAPRTPGGSYRPGSVYSGSISGSFNAADYVRENCHNYTFGGPLSGDELYHIEHDPNLTLSQREEVKQEAARMSTLHY